ncbi:MAG: aspartate kinase, partial [Cyclobacteriaceae bacterium]
MIVQKFGGTSVGKPERMHQVAGLLDLAKGPVVIVLSAVSGTTNALVSINAHYRNGELNEAMAALLELKATYIPFVKALYHSPKSKREGLELIEKYFEELVRLVSQPYYAQIEKVIVVQGELISTHLFQLYLVETGRKSVLLAA